MARFAWLLVTVLAVGVTAFTIVGCGDEDEPNGPGDTENRSPVAEFRFDNDGLSVDFVDESTDPDGDPIISWDWAFGDESGSSDQNPSHDYAASGTYSVQLIVADSLGAMDTVSKDVDVTRLPDFVLYADSGLVSGSDVWTWCGSEWGGPECTFNGAYPDSTAPEGDTCFLTTSGANWSGHANYAGWGIFLVKPQDHTVDLSAHKKLRFWVKTGQDLKLEIQLNNRSGSKRAVRIKNYHWDGTDSWQEIVVPITDFGTSGLDKVFCPFMITVENGSKTFKIDYVRWAH